MKGTNQNLQFWGQPCADVSDGHQITSYEQSIQIAVLIPAALASERSGNGRSLDIRMIADCVQKRLSSFLISAHAWSIVRRRHARSNQERCFGREANFA